MAAATRSAPAISILEWKSHFSQLARPASAWRPRRENQRPLLPQHARHCPVLEAGSALGFMVFPALEPHESFHVEFQGEGQYQFTYFLQMPRPGDGSRLFR